ncbi:MAG: 3-ketoacyl-ACP reductase [Clostridiales bacterium]|nr:3-ketoacyl-ACP reductase [Clostridiales bacterium]
MKKTVIVTGASRGIGRAISLKLAADGFAVVAAARGDAEKAAEYVGELQKLSPESVYVSADISSEEDRRRLVDTAFDRFGGLDILVNNAGVAPTERRDILEMTEESMQRLLDINLKGTFFLTQYAANRMLAAKCGEMIINVTSMSAYTASINRGEYCISKAGLSMATELFAARLAECGINVYEIRPGIIRTDMTAAVTEKYEALIAGGLLPISRMGTPEDIARAVAAVASGALPYSTGEVINVDGGFHIRTL